MGVFPSTVNISTVVTISSQVTPWPSLWHTWLLNNVSILMKHKQNTGYFKKTRQGCYKESLKGKRDSALHSLLCLWPWIFQFEINNPRIFIVIFLKNKNHWKTSIIFSWNKELTKLGQKDLQYICLHTLCTTTHVEIEKKIKCK